jgi:siroheme decarboxylase
MDALDKQVIRVMQDEFPLVHEPYKALAQKINISEEELLRRLQELKAKGKIRKMGAVLQHREVGYAANALCAWKVPIDSMDLIAANMSSNAAVSHCYDRDVHPGWPYNLYTMIHGHSRKECEQIADTLGSQNGISSRVMLFSVKEWKKTSMRYFCEDENANIF